MSDEDFLFLPAPSLEKKYNKLIWVGVLFIFIGLGFMTLCFAYLYMKGVYDGDVKNFSQMLPFLLTIIPGYGVMLCRQAFKGRKMFYKAAMGGLLMDGEGIKGPIALLEGPLRDHLRDKLRQPFFEIEWDRVREFIVEPRRGKRGDAPPYYKIPLKEGDGSMYSSYFILRDYFKGREDKVIRYVKKHLAEEQIILNDELVTEESANND